LTATTGTCNDGSARFLALGDGYVGWSAYYAADTGRLIAVMTHSDMIEPPCGGRHYWPRDYDRGEMFRTEVLSHGRAPDSSSQHE
jgi:hypothetical protein